MLKKLKKKAYGLFHLDNRINSLERRLKVINDTEKVLLAKLVISDLHKKGKLNNIGEAEFSAFSEGGDDGIIQYLVAHTQCEARFVDLGGGNYQSPDTRLLLQHNLWDGLIVDATPVSEFEKEEFTKFYNIRRKQAFITVDNVNELIEQEKIGHLNIDIDGNDYWILKAIKNRPSIVCVEYNSFFGLHPITIPYQSNFRRTECDYGTIYHGASLIAICDLMKERGYIFVGTTRFVSNAYFVLKEKADLNYIKEVTPEEYWNQLPCTEHRDKKGKIYRIDPKEAIDYFLKEAPFVNTKNGKTIKGKDVFN